MLENTVLMFLSGSSTGTRSPKALRHLTFELWECVLDTFAALASLLTTKSGAVLVSGLRLLFPQRLLSVWTLDRLLPSQRCEL